MLKILTDNCLLVTGHCKSIYADAEQISKMLWKIVMNSQKSGAKQ